MEAGEHGLTRGTWFHRGLSRGGRGRRAAVDFVVCFGWGEFFADFFFVDFFLLRTHTACCKYEAASCLIYLSTSTHQVYFHRGVLPTQNEKRNRNRLYSTRHMVRTSYFGSDSRPIFSPISAEMLNSKFLIS